MLRSTSLAAALLALAACSGPADLGPLEADVERLESSLTSATAERAALSERVTSLETQLEQANATIARLESTADAPVAEEVATPRPAGRERPPTRRAGSDTATGRDLTIPEIFR